MTKKMGAKKGIIITMTTILLVLSALLAVLYHNYTKEIRVMEPVEHMEQREGVSINNILVGIEYSVITNGEEVEHYLYVFENGDVYSGQNYFYVGDAGNEEQRERGYCFYRRDEKYWDYLYEQCYWGRLSSHDLNSIMNELAQVEVIQNREDFKDMPQAQMKARMGAQEEIQMAAQMELQADQEYRQENDNIYGGHRYRGRMESEGIEDLEWISIGSAEKATMYRRNEHAHNAIDIIKSTWAYGQWTNQIFGEGWEERIDLKDVWEERT